MFHCMYCWDINLFCLHRYSDGDNIIIIIIMIIGVFRFKLVLRWLCWYYVGCVGISLVALVFRWLRWYFAGSYPLAKCWWKIKLVEKNEDVVRFCTKGLMAAWSKGVYAGMLRGLVGRKEGRKLLECII